MGVFLLPETGPDSYQVSVSRPSAWSIRWAVVCAPAFRRAASVESSVAPRKWVTVVRWMSIIWGRYSSMRSRNNASAVIAEVSRPVKVVSVGDQMVSHVREDLRTPMNLDDLMLHSDQKVVSYHPRIQDVGVCHDDTGREEIGAHSSSPRSFSRSSRSQRA